MVKGHSATTAPGEVSISVTPMAEPYVTESRVMSENVPLQLTLTEHWPLFAEDGSTDYSVTYSVEQMIIAGSAEKGYRKEYQSMLLNKDDESEEDSTTRETTTQEEALPSLVAKLDGQNLTVQVGDTLPSPGTYRLNMEWTYKGLCISNKQIAFYINYMNDTDSAQTGGAEQ